MNKYPIHLDLQYQKLLQSVIEGIDKKMYPELIREYKKELPLDVAEDGINDVFDKFINTFEESLKTNRKFLSKLARIFSIANKWSYRQTEKIIKKAIRRKTFGQSLGIQMDLDDPIIQEGLKAFRRFNMDLAIELGREHIEEVGILAKDAFLNGVKTKDLAKDYLDLAKKNKNKAKFWATDQLSNAYASLTEQRQLSAGFPGYIWSTSKDNRVRGSHSDQEGKFFTWKQGAFIPERGKYLHPGQDYNCRCTAKAAFRPEEK